MTNPRKIKRMGIELEEWTHKSCTAEYGVGDKWATLYTIQSLVRRQGHATTLLKMAKNYYQKLGKKVGGTVALNDQMKRLYRKVGYEEYE